MQNVLYAEDLPKSNSLFASLKFNGDDDCFDELEEEAAYSDYLLGTLAVTFDFIGQMAIAQAKKSGVVMTKKAMLDAVDGLYSSMPKKQRQAIRNGVKFHFYANKIKSTYPKGSVSWRKMYPLSNLEEMDFDQVINTYCSGN